MSAPCRRSRTEVQNTHIVVILAVLDRLLSTHQQEEDTGRHEVVNDKHLFEAKGAANRHAWAHL